MKSLKLSCLSLLALTSGVTLQGQVLNFLLSGSQETVLNQMTGSAGYASVEYDAGTSTLSYEVHYTGTSTLTGIHFHGPAGAGSNASVAIGLSASSSPIIGTTGALTPTQQSDFLAGNWYLNLHTAENPTGELRGQVVPQLSFKPNNIISGSQETGGVLTAAGGAALITYNPSSMELGWKIAYEGIEGTVTGMHFHGPAGLGSNAGVEIGISNLSSETSGIASLTASQADDLLNGLWYINIHSSDFPGGEIRGQILNVTAVPEPSTYALLMGIAGIGFVFWRRRNR